MQAANGATSFHALRGVLVPPLIHAFTLWAGSSLMSAEFACCHSSGLVQARGGGLRGCSLVMRWFAACVHGPCGVEFAAWPMSESSAWDRVPGCATH